MPTVNAQRVVVISFLSMDTPLRTSVIASSLVWHVDARPSGAEPAPRNPTTEQVVTNEFDWSPLLCRQLTQRAHVAAQKFDTSYFEERHCQ